MVTKDKWFDLQLFAEGADGGEGAAQTKGETSPDAAEVTGVDVQAAADERAEGYKKFKADYKAEFDAEVQSILRQRLKSAKTSEAEAQQYRQKAEAIFEALYAKYGTEAGDIDALAAAVAADDAYYEEEALRRGIDVKQLRQIKQIERENARLRADDRQRQEQAYFDELLRQADEVKQTYPSFDFESESMQSPEFVRLIKAGVPMQTAFEVTHKEEILARGMAVAARTAVAKAQAGAAQMAARPDESALGSEAAVQTAVDISKLTPEQMRQYKELARQGKRITFK